jgi:hypothetical protein
MSKSPQSNGYQEGDNSLSEVLGVVVVNVAIFWNTESFSPLS